MTIRRPAGKPTSSTVEVRIYHLGTLKTRHTCRRDEAARITRLWQDVPGMHCRVVSPARIPTP